MNNRSLSNQAVLRVCLFFVLPALAACQEKADPGQILTYQEPHMGTLFTIRTWVPTQGEAEEKSQVLSRRAFDRIAELNAIFSDYLQDSELTRLNLAPADQPVEVSPELFDILTESREVSIATGGAFDITVGPMIRLWRKARKDLKLPSQDQIENARARTGYEKLILDPEKRTVTKMVDHMVLDLGGIAKGYAADQALKILHQGGLSSSLVAASGDIALGDPPPGKDGWSVGLETLEMAHPGAGIELAKAAVSTSGDTQRFIILDGRRYSHIVDTATGYGLTRRIAVSVIAPTATLSDAYATALSVLGKEEGIVLVEKTRFLECRIVTIDEEGHTEVTVSSGYPQ